MIISAGNPLCEYFGIEIESFCLTLIQQYVLEKRKIKFLSTWTTTLYVNFVLYSNI